jgi:hypothetical protein
MPAETITSGADQRRSRNRAIVAQASTVRAHSAVPVDVHVEDLSQDGFCFSSAVAIEIGTVIAVGLAGAGMASARVAWRDGDRHGCVFHPALTITQIDLAFTHSTNAPAVAELLSDVRWIQPAMAKRRRTGQTTRFVRCLLIGIASALCWAVVVYIIP